jgi:hypothetical protein
LVRARVLRGVVRVIPPLTTPGQLDTLDTLLLVPVDGVLPSQCCCGATRDDDDDEELVVAAVGGIPLVFGYIEGKYG